tara:strand:- start:1294 stop:1509 length:216 start_codon:yes stop_codon:yes gene_type:complete
MIDVNANYELYDYVLFVDEKNTTKVSQLTLHEAQQINYAFGINRSNKRYVLKSEIETSTANVGSTLILPKG